jgi:hypothetical protein
MNYELADATNYELRITNYGAKRDNRRQPTHNS